MGSGIGAFRIGGVGEINGADGEGTRQATPKGFLAVIGHVGRR